MFIDGTALGAIIDIWYRSRIRRSRFWKGSGGQHDTYIFPSPRKTGPLGKMGMSRLADRLAGSVHGMRSTFRVWSGQETKFYRVDLELCLSHDIRSAVERAYDRSDRLDKRRVIMQAWADYVAGR